MTVQVLKLEDRLRRSKGRTGRTRSANAKVTADEQDELERAAAAEGKALSEWAREVLLREARARVTERATFTEVVALRKLLSSALTVLLAGKTMPQEQYAVLLAEIRDTKHTAAREVLEQYTQGGR